MIIYKINNTITGKSYIGKTTQSFKERWSKHKDDAKQNKNSKNHFYNAIKKYGTNCWLSEVIEEMNDPYQSETLLNQREIYWIAYYDTYNNGYNSTKGGEGTRGHKHSDESIKKNSESNKGREPWNKGKTGLQVAWNKGIPCSEETKRKSAETQRDHIPSNKGKHGLQTAWNKGHTGQVPWNKGKTGLQVAWNKGLKRKI